ncbi:hypothetical protein JW935_24310 [candidate division KSB1 bacterium]|nr:hypothetical protein [candidate division KSB1 bacterium]
MVIKRKGQLTALLNVICLILVLLCSGVLGKNSGKRWDNTTLKSLDPWGDTKYKSFDILATYYRQNSDSCFFRIDFLDLDQDTIPAVILLIDNEPGGETQVQLDNNTISTDIQWDYLIRMTGEGYGQLLNFLNQDKSDSLWDISFDTQLDFLRAVVSAKMFDTAENGLTMQALTYREDTVIDKTLVFTTQDTAGRAKLVLSFMNAFIGYGPHAVSWYDGYAQQYKNRPRTRGGFRYLLDAVEKYRLPLTVNDLRIEQLPGNEYLGINERLIQLWKNKLLDPLSTLNYGHFMCWQSDRVDDKAINIMRDLRNNMELFVSDVFYPYETMIRYNDLDVIKNAGFKAIYGLDRYPYWFGPVTDWGDAETVRAVVESSKKIHQVGDMKFFFLPIYGGFAWDTRWEDLDWSLDMWDGTDDGLFLWLRRILHDMAIDPDQEKVFTLGTDLNLTSWLYHEDLERDFKWIAGHPWIEVTTFSDILTRGWTPIIHESGSDPQQPLEQYLIENDGHYNAYFWQYYDGGISDGHSPVVPAGVEIESYRDYVPYLRDGEKIPSGIPMGDEQTNGAIIKNTVDGLFSCPDNDLTTLAWLSYFNGIAEQTLHAGRFYEGNQAAGGDFGGQYLHPAAKFRANDLRQVNKLTAAAKWVQDVLDGRMYDQTTLTEQDLDLDGENEYLMQNNRLCLIFENDGGRLEYAFSYHPQFGAVQHIAPVYQQMFTSDGWGWDYTMGEVATAPTWNQQADAAFVDDLDGDWQFDYPVYDVSVQNNNLVFTAPDCVLVKTIRLEGNQVVADYDVKSDGTAGFGIGLVVNMFNMFNIDWDDRLSIIQAEKMIKMQTVSGGLSIIDYSDPDIYLVSLTSFNDSPAAQEKQERDSYEEYPAGHWLYYPYNSTSFSGKGKFCVKLNLFSNAAETRIEKYVEKHITGIKLWDNYPNPFNNETRIKFDLITPGYVELKVFSSIGQEIKTLLKKTCRPGHYVISWDGTDESNMAVASGIYLFRIESSESVMVKSCVLVR